MKYKGIIEITLKSDLCAGSGYAFAGIVDSDVCYDNIGIPYIPGKRLKGCFRETANSFLHSLYDEALINSLFGERGQRFSSKLTIGNAYITGHDEISGFLKSKINEYPDKYNQQSILQQYSHIIGQTKLTENGSAEEGSLRYTRVVNHYAPGDAMDELTFEAPISGDFDDKEKETLTNIIRATKNIGLKRNRGLGSVSCNITELKENKDDTMTVAINGSDDSYVIHYAVTNKDPLILSSESSEESEDYSADNSEEYDYSESENYLADNDVYEEFSSEIPDEEFEEIFY